MYRHFPPISDTCITADSKMGPGGRSLGQIVGSYYFVLDHSKRFRGGNTALLNGVKVVCGTFSKPCGTRFSVYHNHTENNVSPLIPSDYGRNTPDQSDFRPPQEGVGSQPGHRGDRGVLQPRARPALHRCRSPQTAMERTGGCQLLVVERP